MLRYVIACNGAQVLDRESGSVLYRAELPWQRAVGLMEYLDTLPVIYDCYLDDAAWISASQRPLIPAFSPRPFVLEMWQRLRRPVPELKDFVRQQGRGVQKLMCLFQDMALRERLLKTLPQQFPDLSVTSSILNNIEFNHRDANKGAGLRGLAAKLGVPMEQTLAIGDDWNDLPMLEAAGVGVAMATAPAEVRARADACTLSCDEAGVAAALSRFFPAPGPLTL